VALRCHRTCLARFIAALSLGATIAGAQVPANSSELDTPAAQAPITPSKAIGGTHNCSGFYPDTAEGENEAGDVLIRYDVLADGIVSNVTLLKSSGFDQLDRAAILCVSQRWRNTAAVQGGVPIATANHEAIVLFTLLDARNRIGRLPGLLQAEYFIGLLMLAWMLILFVIASLIVASRYLLSVFAMRACPGCGADNRASFSLPEPKFCRQCGKPLAPTPRS
jgi:TonB family protein